MTKKTYRWLTIGGAVFLTIAFVAAVVLSTRSTKRASAAEIDESSYITQWYTMNTQSGSKIQAARVRFRIRVEKMPTGNYSITFSCESGQAYGSINVVGKNDINTSGTFQIGNDSITVKFNSFMTDLFVNGINYSYVQVTRSGTSTSNYVYTQSIYFYYGGTNETTYVSISYTCPNIWAQQIEDDPESTSIVVEYRANPGSNETSYNQGYINGQNSMQGKINSARDEGYNSGYAAGAQQTSSLGNILLGIGGVPFETLQSILDFDLLGVNISSLVMSILTAAIAIWIMKLFI